MHGPNKLWFSNKLLLGPLIFIGGEVTLGQGNLYCLNARTGRRVWKFKAADGVWSSPIVTDGYVYAGSGDGHFDNSGYMYCLDAQTGEKVWEFETDRDIDSSPVVTGDYIYVGGNNRLII
jgi:outer membrane protein assembly factor BamB